VSTGEEGNITVELARREFVAQFDDDDYYAPQYLETMLDCIARESADFDKLVGFFLYSKVLGQLGYWDQQRKDGSHHVWSGEPTEETMVFPDIPEISDMHLGYGFSHVFERPSGKPRSSRRSSGTRTRRSSRRRSLTVSGSA
jgi:hypothetical protein